MRAALIKMRGVESFGLFQLERQFEDDHTMAGLLLTHNTGPVGTPNGGRERRTRRLAKLGAERLTLDLEGKNSTVN